MADMTSSGDEDDDLDLVFLRPPAPLELLCQPSTSGREAGGTQQRPTNGAGMGGMGERVMHGARESHGVTWAWFPLMY